MPHPHEVDQSKLVEALAAELEKKLPMPEWAKYVKTGTSRDRPPEQANWWWLRAASILRKASIDGPVGTERLRTYYGSRKNRGHKPEHFRKASGKVVRAVLQELERAKLVEAVSKPWKGRAVTRDGQRLLDSIAKQLKV